METLAQWIHRRGTLAPKDAVGWAIRLAKHLEALHLHGVAHGNVSPACLLLEQSPPHGRGMVADVRRTAEMVQYHSPERFRNGQLSPSDDAWGLAGTLFTAITGARPFGETKAEVERRIPQGLQPAAFGIKDDRLAAILANALVADPGRRTATVAGLRGQLEQWYGDPSVRDLVALEDEDANEEDGAATTMLPMDRMVFEESSTSKHPESLGNMFAPASYDPRSGTPGSAPRPPASKPGAPQPLSAGPLGEQDATVMRELPAHIMAMAARAASGSNPPPPPPEPAPSEPPDESDFGGATKIAPAPDINAMLASTINNNVQSPLAAPPAPPAPLAPPPAPTRPAPLPPVAPPPSAGGRPPIPRAFKSTQLGMGGLAPPLPPMAPPVQGGPPPAPAPRPGFMPPPTSISTNPPPNLAAGPGAPGIPLAELDIPSSHGDDDDDGGRTVMRESPGASEIFRSPAPNAQQPQAQWKPAPPPMQPLARHPSEMGSGTDRIMTPNPGGGVSALIQETLENHGPGGGAFPQPLGHEITGQGLGGGPMAGPFQPLGMGGQAPAAAFNAAPWTQPGHESSGSYAFGNPAGAAPAPGALPGLMPPGGLDSGFNRMPFNQDAGNAQALQQPVAQPYPVGGVIAPAAGTDVAPARKRGSRASLFIVCFLVLILAAAVTFSVLRFRPQLGF